MLSKKQTQLDKGTRSKGKQAKRDPNEHQSTSSNTVTINDIEADSTSNIQMQVVVEEREMSSSTLQLLKLKRNPAILSILRQNENSEHEITDSELDSLQWELESLLSKLIECKNTMKNDLNLFASCQNKIIKNFELPTTKAKVTEILSDSECSSNSTYVEYSPQKELPPNQTESANTFWSLVEPFRAHVSQEDLNWLENLVSSYGPNKKCTQIPPLGEHYSKRWAKEELEMQNQQASSSNQPNTNTELADQVPPHVVELINKINNAAHNSNKLTPVYQTVIAALLEHSKMLQENVKDDSDVDDDKYKPEEMSNDCILYGAQHIKKLLQTLELNINNDKPVTSSSSLPHSSSQVTDANDEILEEITKCDAALSNLQRMNKDHLTKILERCRQDNFLQKKKKKLQKIDNQILNLKKKLQKKKIKTAQMYKEYQDMRFLLDKRSNYLMKLQSYNANPTNIHDSESSDEEEFITTTTDNTINKNPNKGIKVKK